MSYQFLLNGQNANSSGLTVGLLARDDDHLGVAVLGRQVNFSVGFLTNLKKKKKCLKRKIKAHYYTYERFKDDAVE